MAIKSDKRVSTNVAVYDEFSAHVLRGAELGSVAYEEASTKRQKRKGRPKKWGIVRLTSLPTFVSRLFAACILVEPCGLRPVGRHMERFVEVHSSPKLVKLVWYRA